MKPQPMHPAPIMRTSGRSGMGSPGLGFERHGLAGQRRAGRSLGRRRVPRGRRGGGDDQRHRRRRVRPQHIAQRLEGAPAIRARYDGGGEQERGVREEGAPCDGNSEEAQVPTLRGGREEEA
eukprot:scaffold37866_cov47-Phaeocystis_antarctica.AAC.2